MPTHEMKEVLRFRYNNQPVTVVAQKSIDEFTLQETSFGPVEKGGEFSVPHWIAETLIASNMATLKDERVKVPTLQKTLWQETEDSSLQTLSYDFFQQVRKSIEELSFLNEKEPNDVRLAAQTRMEHLFRDLVGNRLLKLMKLSLREERLRETKKKMTGEERWLFDQLVALVRNWQTQVLEIELGG